MKQIKRYVFELSALLLQVGLFYLMPPISLPQGAIGLVLLLLPATAVVSLLLGLFSKNKLKFAFPLVVALVFLPSVPLFYNESALIHALWYFVSSLFGLGVGAAARALSQKGK